MNTMTTTSSVGPLWREVKVPLVSWCLGVSHGTKAQASMSRTQIVCKSIFVVFYRRRDTCEVWHRVYMESSRKERRHLLDAADVYVMSGIVVIVSTGRFIKTEDVTAPRFGRIAKTKKIAQIGCNIGCRFRARCPRSNTAQDRAQVGQCSGIVFGCSRHSGGNRMSAAAIESGWVSQNHKLPSEQNLHRVCYAPSETPMVCCCHVVLERAGVGQGSAADAWARGCHELGKAGVNELTGPP